MNKKKKFKLSKLTNKRFRIEEKDGVRYKVCERNGKTIRVRLVEKMKTGNPRCSAVKANGKQCPMPACGGHGVCKYHGGKGSKQTAIVPQKKGREIVKARKWLAAEVNDLRKAPEVYRNCVYEIELITALIEKVRGQKDAEKKVMEKPGQFVWMLSELAKVKEIFNKILHNVRMTFTIDEMRTVFQQFNEIVLRVVKDDTMLEQFAQEMKMLAIKTTLKGSDVKMPPPQIAPKVEDKK